MAIVLSLIWTIMVVSVMLLTIKYYLPRLSERSEDSDSKALESSSEKCESSVLKNKNKYVCNNVILRKRMYAIIMLVVCACIAAWCGYSVAEHAITVSGIVKMTLAMCVLSCVFITDMELMMIPNMCSIVLLIGRLIIVICEFVWMKEDALVWFLNSIVAMVTSLILLLIMAKVTRGGLGMGDVKLFSSFGFLCGIQAVCFTLVFSFFLCALASTGLLATKKKHLKDALPLGPFIWLGYGVAVLLAII